MQFLLPMLRADFAICETYAYMEDARLDCALSVFGGLQDSHVSDEDLAAWREQTNGPFALRCSGRRPGRAVYAAAGGVD